MPKTATSQKGPKKTSTTAVGTSHSRAQRAAAAAAKKNTRQEGKLRKKLSHRQATETRDLLDAEFRDLRVKVSTSFARSLQSAVRICNRALMCASMLFLPSDNGTTGGPAAA